ncbi:hypothetical protein ABEF93_000899 [Exophiala dermatitidis]
MVPPVGIIITVTVLVAAGVAAYENPQVRAWIGRTRHKIAMGLHSLGDEIHPTPNQRRRTSLNDASMHEEKGEMADERRRQAIAEIMERGRLMEERRKRRKLSGQDKSRATSFDSMVDENGMLLHDLQNKEAEAAASSSAIDPSAHSQGLKHRQKPSLSEETPSPLYHSVDTLPSSSQLPRNDPATDTDLFESRYEKEMREAWNMNVSDRANAMPPSHASESLIDLTPTTEEAPDPDFSVPSADQFQRPLSGSGYFGSAVSNSTRTLSDDGSQDYLPVQSHNNVTGATTGHFVPGNGTTDHSAVSVTGSMSSIHPSEAEESSDDLLSEVGDGMRTPASVWTEVDSTVSGDFQS